ncbi:12323_t:CDS:2 [Ambispora leptoticha]|uniref:12323_t:CDS:1 n=1 Tax=Ambispora leptoticha TaxID=144679 RepID=A0A9N8ZPU0_9GLOM|nr:12323_t:CDS:2 [Ambispora leptoticha]
MEFSVSLQEQIRGMIAVCVFSTISNLATTIMLFLITRQNVVNKTVTYLVVNLLIGDWIQSVGFMITYYWLSDGGNIHPGTICDFQGILINMGDVSSGFWAFTICLHTFSLVVFSYDPKYFLQISMAIIWPVVTVISVIGLSFQNLVPLFVHGNFGNFYDYLVFGHVHNNTVATSKNKDETNEKTDDEDVPYSLTIAAGCILTSAGIVNSIIYGFTRNIVSIKHAFPKLHTNSSWFDTNVLDTNDLSRVTINVTITRTYENNKIITEEDEEATVCKG